MKSRVAMDFSGERGRVVADPNEALGVAFEEGYNWRVSLTCVVDMERVVFICHWAAADDLHMLSGQRLLSY